MGNNVTSIFLYGFEVIFSQRFHAVYSINMETMWHHVSELQANFRVPTYNVGDKGLTPMDKEHMGSHPKMVLFALDELFYVY